MEFNPKCLINIFLAILALILYIIGSYRFYKNRSAYKLILGLAILVDVATATLASFKITPTTQIPEMKTVPWDSFLFQTHVAFSMIGFLGFILLFIYLLGRRSSGYKNWIRKWQFVALLPIWTIGESIAIGNAISKICYGSRLFELLT